MKRIVVSVLLVAHLVHVQSTEDITKQVFGDFTNIIPSAFGDFNSDELTDLFITRNNSSTIEILLGSNENEPILKRSNLKCRFRDSVITSVVPGDFNGDAFMDVVVTVHYKMKKDYYVHVLHGGLNTLNCSFNESHPLIKMKHEPLAFDYNNDFIIDLLSVDMQDKRAIWIFNNDNTTNKIDMHDESTSIPKIRDPHSNAFLDLNNDNHADLFITTEGPKIGQYQFEIWSGPNFKIDDTKIIKGPESITKIGQSIFLDVELLGKFDHVLPVINGEDSKVMFYSSKVNEWRDLNVNFVDPQGIKWSFFPIKNHEELLFLNTITLRSGDYNMDGYPDLIGTLVSPISTSRTFLFENVPCSVCKNYTRTFSIKWDGITSSRNETLLGVFYDIYQDGILDIILIEKNEDFKIVAYKNTLDYDANFVKVMVLTGLTNSQKPTINGALGKRKITYGTNLPGPKIVCKTLDQDGKVWISVSPQIPQSAHYSLNLPYTMFGLGRTPNFVSSLGVGFASKSKDWPQVIPNSQMVIIPNPVDEPNKWKMQLFVTPSKIILKSVFALLGICVFITLIIGILHWKEKKVDRLERSQEAYRFHFDAM